MQVITVATMSSLPRARVLARSLSRHQPDWPLTVMLIGREEAIAATAREETLAADVALGLRRSSTSTSRHCWRATTKRT